MRGVFKWGPWQVEYRPEDGGRLSRLSFKGYDLLTKEPLNFRPPLMDCGDYEKRPVYGYDDCFPSIGACPYPGTGLYIPDHGEICWLPWNVSAEGNTLDFYVGSTMLPLMFRRKMTFNDSSIDWDFEVINNGDFPLPFQHSMHALMRTKEIVWLDLPAFDSVFDWNRKETMPLFNPQGVREFLLGLPDGSVEMLFLRNINIGQLAWSYSNGMKVQLEFPEKHFPTLGIWWNKSGYPDEDGLRRDECAFEPIAGLTAVLSHEHANGNSLSVDRDRGFKWRAVWQMGIASPPIIPSKR